CANSQLLQRANKLNSVRRERACPSQSHYAPRNRPELRLTFLFVASLPLRQSPNYSSYEPRNRIACFFKFHVRYGTTLLCCFHNAVTEVVIKQSKRHAFERFCRRRHLRDD